MNKSSMTSEKLASHATVDMWLERAAMPGLADVCGLSVRVRSAVRLHG